MVLSAQAMHRMALVTIAVKMGRGAGVDEYDLCSNSILRMPGA